MLLKSVIQGRLEFGKKSTYDTVVTMLLARLDTFYKNETIFILEEVLFEDTFSMNLGRITDNPDLKYWNNSIGLIEYARQYAIAGAVSAWLIEDRKVKESHFIEPRNEKVVVQSYLKGRKFGAEDGQEELAIKHLNRAISKFERHALAYSERGKVYLKLGKEKEALQDFNKAIELDDALTDPFFFRGKVNMHNLKWNKAIDDFEAAIKNSVAREEIHWQGRRLIAKCYIEVENFEKAAFNLKLLSIKQFDKDSENLPYQHKAIYDYAYVLLQLETPKEALVYLEKAIAYKTVKEQTIPLAQMLILKGYIQKAIGVKSYQKEWKKAVELGSKEAKALLQQHASK